MSTQLGAQDAQFLYLQAGDVLTHVMSINLYDPATARGGKVRYEDIVRHIASRCDLSPVYRRRLHRVPGDLDLPYWVEDSRFDAAGHIAKARLPRPGGWPQFCRLVAKRFAQPMDLDRPLWDILVVEGLDSIPDVAPGSYSLLQRFHHAAIDGTSGAYALAALCDLDAQGTPAVQPPAAAARRDIAPSHAAMVTRALAAGISAPVRMADAVLKLSPALAAAARARLVDGPTAERAAMPVTRFNRRVTARRIFAAKEVRLEDLQAIRRSVEGATVNDVILAIGGGALRAYLARHSELPDEPLVAVVPINARKPAVGPFAAGNDISAMTVPLATQLADPLARLRAIRRSTSAAKGARAGLGTRLLADLMRQVPGVTLSGLARLAGNERIARSQANLVISNVPGSRIPLYMNGARLTHQYGMGPVTHGLGLFMSANGYGETIAFCLTADAKLVPDLEFLCECVETARAELQAAARAVAMRTTVKRRKRAVARRRQAGRE